MFLISKLLLSKNIKIVFGVPSSSIDGILNYIPSQIKWVNTGLELQNGFISQVYGSYTNNVGILFTGTGPSIATAISSIKNAECENKPLLVITTFEKRDN
jgi:acetolactate synthase-1/2/3 large subunit